jgi:hypothetical protein
MPQKHEITKLYFYDLLLIIYLYLYFCVFVANFYVSLFLERTHLYYRDQVEKTELIL